MRNPGRTLPESDAIWNGKPVFPYLQPLSPPTYTYMKFLSPFYFQLNKCSWKCQSLPFLKKKNVRMHDWESNPGPWVCIPLPIPQKHRGFRAADRGKGLIWSYIALYFESERHPNHYYQGLTPIIHGHFCNRLSTARPYVTWLVSNHDRQIMSELCIDSNEISCTLINIVSAHSYTWNHFV